MKNLVGLARVSTIAQDDQLQRDTLETAGCIKIFEEKNSSRSSNRPGLADALDYMRDGIDTLVVWKFDRLGRSTKDILTVADHLSAEASGCACSPEPSPAPTARRGRGSYSSR